VAYALTYIPLFFVAIVALLLGGRGGSVAVALLTVLVLVNTAQGDGPFAETALYHGDSLLIAQLYLAVAALLTLLISTLRTAREQTNAQAAAARMTWNWRWLPVGNSSTASIRIADGCAGAAASNARWACTTRRCPRSTMSWPACIRTTVPRCAAAGCANAMARCAAI
jgi:hypothetical protein